jgi:hypothetical protein
VKRFLQLGTILLALFVAASAYVHPYGSVKAARSEQPLLAGAEVDPELVRIVERSCQNCHSEKTEWPWYSYLAPLSWMIENDVRKGRNHMNLSHWDRYPEDRKVELLTKIGVEVRNRRMPLPNYLRLHPQARLSDNEVAQIYAWMQGERRRLRAVIRQKSRVPAD